MDTIKILPGQDAGDFCTCCDSTSIGPGVLFRTLFGTIVTGKDSLLEDKRRAVGLYVGVRLFICEPCMTQIGGD